MSKLFVSMYHYVRDLKYSRYPEIKGLDANLFRKQIEFMTANFAVIRMEQLLDAVLRKTDLPKNPILLTFDDGYIDNYTYVMPILEEFGHQGSFFIPGKTFVEHKLLDVNKIHYLLASANVLELTEDLKHEMDFYRGNDFQYPSTQELYDKYAVANRFDSAETIFIKRILQTALPERLRNIISSKLFAKYVGVTEEQLAYELYLTEDQIRTMKRHGMHIGLHGFDHYWLANLSETQMKQDLDLALDALGEFIDKNCWTICYPYGNYNAHLLKVIKESGACLGFTTEVRRADLNIDLPLTLPRLDCNDFPPKSKNYKYYIEC